MKQIMKIGIIGVGNIGTRYLQGLAKTFPETDFYLVDSEARLNELRSLHIGRSRYFSSLDAITEHIDLYIVATSSVARLALYKQCLARNPRFIILEKYLFQSRPEFTEALKIATVPTYVNQWMYGSGAFKRIFDAGAKTVKLSGSNWGLACNAVHWIDVLQRHMGILTLQVGSQSVIDSVFESKRPGYEEVYGKWVFEDAESGKSFELIDRPDPGNPAANPGMSFDVDGVSYFFDYKSVFKDKVVIGQFPYFSEQVGEIVAELFETNACRLPTLQKSVSQHLLIEDILDMKEPRPKVT